MDGARKTRRVPSTPPAEPDLGLRERKAAATRIAIVRALGERLAETPLSEISADDLARDANVSRMTFFNYFPTKEHAVDLLMLLWLLEIEQDLAKRKLRGTRAIERIFALFGDEVAAAPARMKHVLAHFASRPADRPLPALGAAELAALTGSPAVVPDLRLSLGGLFMRALDQAIEDGELELVGSTYEMAHFLGALVNGAALVGHSSPDTDWPALFRRHALRALGKLGKRARATTPEPRIPAQYRKQTKRGTRS
jgi:AcrR family transcriptional regulator